MPFSSVNLGALAQGNGFTLWHYRTPDLRATVAAAGYFAPVANTLEPGDIIILQAADALALVPVRSNAAIGTGTTLDGAVGPLALIRAVSQFFSVSQAATAIVRSIILAPLAAGIVVGGTIPVSATVIGPVAQVVFTLTDGNGAVLPPVRTRNVVNGTASTSFPAPPEGSGYRIRVEDASDPALGQTSRSFSIGPDLRRLLAEDDGLLLTEANAALRQ